MCSDRFPHVGGELVLEHAALFHASIPGLKLRRLIEGREILMRLAVIAPPEVGAPPNTEVNIAIGRAFIALPTPTHGRARLHQN
jgi:hypothetical protein